jgi:peptide/nickel transport system substrate-binding protein
MARRFSRAIAILATLAVVLAACTSTTSGGPSGQPATGAKAAYGGSVTFAMNADISNMDPMLSGLFVDRHLMYAMYDSLVRVTPKGEIIPWLSALPTVSADGKSYTFKLRTDVKYHERSRLAVRTSPGRRSTRAAVRSSSPRR